MPSVTTVKTVSDYTINVVYSFLSRFHNGYDVYLLARHEVNSDVKTFELRWTNLVETVEELQRLNDAGYGIYFTVNGGGTKASEIDRITAHFMEIDDLPLDEQMALIKSFPLEPSIITYSGGKSYHCYWMVVDGRVEDFEYVQARLCAYFGADNSRNSLQAKMRLPGFYNRKQSGGKLCEIISMKPLFYTQQQLIDVTPDVERKHKREARVFDTSAPEYATLRDMIDSQLDNAKIQATKTACSCILPEHDDRSPSAVIFYDSGWYVCSACNASMPLLEAIERAGFTEAVQYAKDNRLYKTDAADTAVIEALGYDFDEYSHNVIYSAGLLSQYEPVRVPQLDDGFTRTARRIAKETAIKTVEKLRQRNGNIKRETIQDIANIARLFAYPNDLNAIVPIAGQPGLGKSTLLKTFGLTALELDETFGAVFVTRTVEEAKELADVLNEKKDIDGNEIIDPEGLNDFNAKAIVLQSWSPDICVNKKMREYGQWFPGMCSKENCDKRHLCPLIAQRQEQKFYPIVVMTHERLVQESYEDDNFAKTYGNWKPRYDLENTYRRKAVIIDEKPELTRKIVIDEPTLRKLEGAILEVANKREEKGEDCSHIKAELQSITNVLRQFNEHKRDTNMYVNFDIEGFTHISPALLSFAKESVSREAYKILRDIERMLQHGGATLATHYGIKDMPNWQLSFSYFTPMSLKPFNVFILDGTSRISPDYDRKRCSIYQCAPIRDYSNWNIIQVYAKQSKTKLLHAADDENVKTAALVRNRALKHHDKVLVVTLKVNADKLAQELAPEIEAGRVTVAYDGNLIGTNEFKDYTCAVISSHIELPPAMYEAMYRNVYESLTGSRMSEGFIDTFKYKYDMYYVNEEIQATKMQSIVENLTQTILRIDRDPNSRKQVDVYLLTRNPILPEMLAEQLPGASVRVEYMDEFRIKHKDAVSHTLADIAYKALKESPDGKLPKKELAKAAGIAPTTLRENLRRQDVKDAIDALGMKITTRYIEWK